MGLTVWLPPFEERLKLLPSVPLTVTWVALVAETVRTEELPEMSELGAALMVTVGAEELTSVLTVAPQPARRLSQARQHTRVTEERARREASHSAHKRSARFFLL